MPPFCLLYFFFEKVFTFLWVLAVASKERMKRMENKIMVFTNEMFGTLRGKMIDGQPWFVGHDVANALGYTAPRNAIKAHVDNEDKNTAPIQCGIQGNPNMTVINESGLYSLILSSKLPSAKEFKRWVTNDILPSIRKHGAYVTDELLANGDKLNQTMEELKAEHALRIKAERENDELRLRCDTAENKLAVIDEKNKAKVEKLLATNKAKREAESLTSAQVLVAMARRIAIKHCRGDFKHGTNSLYKTIECSGIDLRARRDEWLSTHAANKSSNAPKLYEFIRADEMDGCILAVTNYFSRIDFNDIVSRHNKAA